MPQLKKWCEDLPEYLMNCIPLPTYLKEKDTDVIMNEL